MKRLILSVLIAITAFAAHAQHDYFDKYADMEGVTSVYVSKTMFKFIQRLPIESDDVDMSGIIKKLDGLYILTTEEPEIMEALRKETAFINKKEGYEELMRVKEDGEKVTIYMKEQKNARTEYVLIMDSTDEEFVVMIFSGTLQPEDVQGIVNKE